MRYSDEAREERIQILEKELKELKSSRPSWIKRQYAQEVSKLQEKVRKAKVKVGSCMNKVIIEGLFFGVFVTIGIPIFTYEKVRRYVAPNIPLVPKKKRARILAERMWELNGGNPFAYRMSLLGEQDDEFMEPNPKHIAGFLKVYREELRAARQTSSLCKRSLSLLEGTDENIMLNALKRRKKDADYFVKVYGPVIRATT